MSDIKHVLLDIIPKTRESALNMRELADLLGITTRQLKYVIFSMRAEYPICSSDDPKTGGYWLSENQTDIGDTIRMLEHRIESQIKTIKRMRGHLERL